MIRFALSSEECELLVALDAAGSTDGAAKLLAKHASVVSRQLTSLSERAPVLEKPQGRWRLSATGTRMVQWAREQAAVQAGILAAPSRVRIATTREFGARVVAPHLGELRSVLGVAYVDVALLASRIEREVLEGRADVGITCGRAKDPAVAFRGLVDESYVLVVPASWPKRSLEVTLEEPHIADARMSTTALLRLDREVSDVAAVLDDIAAVREACVAGNGWCVVPRYTVAREIESGALRVVEGTNVTPDRFGVFWLRSRTKALPWLDALCDWVAARDL